MNDINDSISHLYDGVDIDAPRHRQSFRFPEASNLVDDMQELRLLDEADLKHYAGSPRGMARNTNRKR